MERFRLLRFELFDLHSPAVGDGDDDGDVYSIPPGNHAGTWHLWMEQATDAVCLQLESFPKLTLIYPQTKSLVLPRQVASPQWEPMQIVYMKYL